MSDESPRVNVGGALAVPLAAASQGVQAAAKLAGKHKLADKWAQVSELKDHKIVARLSSEKDLLLTVLGLVLVFHGAQFKNLFLCTQLVITFLLTRFKKSISTIYEDLKTVAEKAEADAPEPEAKKEVAAEDGKSKREMTAHQYAQHLLDEGAPLPRVNSENPQDDLVKSDDGEDEGGCCGPRPSRKPKPPKHEDKKEDKEKADKEKADKEKADKGKADKEKAVKEKAAKVDLEAATEKLLEATKKLLKALDSERLTNATKEVLISLMACLVVIHGGLAQHVVIAHALVTFTAERAEALLFFEGFDEIKPWTMIMMHFGLWVIMLPMTMLTSNLALILNCAFVGAQLTTTHGATFVGKIGKFLDALLFGASDVPDARPGNGAESVLVDGNGDVLVEETGAGAGHVLGDGNGHVHVEGLDAVGTSVMGLAAFGGLVAAGFFWQSWTLASGGGLYWPFWVLYLPAVVGEAILGCI